MSNNLLFSIVIPSYNRSQLIKGTIQSILSQEYKNFEIILVDDGSTDNTEEIIAEFNNPKLLYFKIKNSERGFARNYGTTKSSGDYITFLDSDDLLLPSYFSNALESIEKYKFPPFLHLGYEIRNQKGETLYRINNLKTDDLNLITTGNPLSCTGVFLRRDISQKFSFNPDRELAGSEDWELWLRIIANYGIKTDNRISAYLIHHDSRSVVNTDEKSLYKRKELAMKYAFQDKIVREKFGHLYNLIDAYADSYISLHLALAGKNTKSIYYFLRSFKQYPPAVLSRRTCAIIKYLLLNLVK